MSCSLGSEVGTAGHVGCPHVVMVTVVVTAGAVRQVAVETSVTDHDDVNRGAQLPISVVTATPAPRIATAAMMNLKLHMVEEELL